jgi:hypothetical protein
VHHPIWARKSCSSEKNSGSPGWGLRHRDAAEQSHESAVPTVLQVDRGRGEDEPAREHGGRDQRAVERMDVVAHRECAADPPEPGAAFGAGAQDHPCQQNSSGIAIA